MQIRFYINQFHLWNNSMFSERIWFFFFFILYTFLYLYIYFLLFVYIYFTFSHLFMPNQFFDKKKKEQELKQNNWKYLRDRTRTRVTKISRISWMRHFPVNCFFFYSEGQSFFLHGQDKDNDSFTWPLV